MSDFPSPLDPRRDNGMPARGVFAPLALAYDSPLSPGQVRPHAPGDGSLVVDVGPLPIGRQLAALAPLVVVFGLLCFELTVLLWSLLVHRGAVPIDKLLLVPSALVWAAVGLEGALQFREASAPVRLTVGGGAVAFPYPTPRSPAEPFEAADIVRLEVSSAKTRVLGRRRAVLAVTLRQGATFDLLPGYPAETLEQICDLLGPALGLDSAPARSPDGPGPSAG